MSNNKLDNVFSLNVDEKIVEIKAAYFDVENEQKEKITDKDVENIKSIKIAHSDFIVFLRTVLSAAIKLEKEFNVNLGLEAKKEDKND